MNSKDLINQLIKRHGTAYKVTKNCGIEAWKISKIRNKNQRFSPDELALLVKIGEISKEDAKNIHFYDDLKNKKNFKLVASLLLTTGSPALFSVLPIFEQLQGLYIM